MALPMDLQTFERLPSRPMEQQAVQLARRTPKAISASKAASHAAQWSLTMQLHPWSDIMPFCQPDQQMLTLEPHQTRI